LVARDERARISFVAFGPLNPLRALCSLDALDALGTLRTLRPLRPHRPLATHGASRPHVPFAREDPTHHDQSRPTHSSSFVAQKHSSQASPEFAQTDDAVTMIPVVVLLVAPSGSIACTDQVYVPTHETDVIDTELLQLEPEVQVFVTGPNAHPAGWLVLVHVSVSEPPFTSVGVAVRLRVPFVHFVLEHAHIVVKIRLRMRAAVWVALAPLSVGAAFVTVTFRQLLPSVSGEVAPNVSFVSRHTRSVGPMNAPAFVLERTRLPKLPGAGPDAVTSAALVTSQR
jgi:hypothetical protein